MKTPNLKKAFTLVELLVVITIIAILAGIALPVFTTIQERGRQTKDLSNAKQIGLCLKLYAGDNDGNFPVVARDGVTAMAAGTTSNDLLSNLVPGYTEAEKIFHVAKSKWCNTAAPDELKTTTTDRLSAGENNYAYCPNMTDTSNPNFPLLADGFSTSTVGAYVLSETDPGGVWKGKKAIVIRADQSGSVEKCNSNFRIFGATGTSAQADIFVAASNWISASQVPRNPTLPP